jgi:polyisoprenoid-binding protein YceI
VFAVAPQVATVMRHWGRFGRSDFMRKMNIGILAAASLLVIAPLAAQNDTPPQLPGKIDVSRVTAGTYQSDPSHSLVGFRVNHFGFNDYFGVFGDVTGTLMIDPANPNAAKVDVKDASFFDAEKFPTVRFVSTKVTVDGTSAMIEGDLTLRGVTKPVTLEADFTGAGINPFVKKETIGFEATTLIKRSDFGMNQAVPLVSDEVRLGITAAFEKG